MFKPKWIMRSLLLVPLLLVIMFLLRQFPVALTMLGVWQLATWAGRLRDGLEGRLLGPDGQWKRE